VPRFSYPCRFEGRSWAEVERAYIDVLSRLSASPVREDDLRAAIDWSALHEAGLRQLKHEERVTQRNGVLRLRTAAEYREEVSEPTVEPLRTIYQYGSVPGCHDNAVFAMIAWYEMVGLSWPETKESVVTWLRESGTWDRGGFEEASPESLVEEKRHVYEAGYGWKEKAQSAKRVIDRHRG
jgi:hypothetical protein